MKLSEVMVILYGKHNDPQNSEKLKLMILIAEQKVRMEAQKKGDAGNG